jgi:hypothetical protein
MRRSGFRVTVHETTDMASVKVTQDVPEHFQSCHTASVGGYVIEGHVPAGDIRHLLAEQPQAKGLAVPGIAAFGAEHGSTRRALHRNLVRVGLW